MRVFLLISLVMLHSLTFAQKKGWKAGVAKVAITPEGPLWMAGFAIRTHPSEGKLHDLWAKALALEDAEGKQAILITTDLLGFPKSMSDEIRNQLLAKYKLSKAQIILNSSHTHSGPVLGNALSDIYPLQAADQKKIDAYSSSLVTQIVTLAGNALKALQPATLQSQNGVARFQVNRRNNNAATLERLTEITGPGDAAVPVLKVSDAKGKMLAVAFGYACHPTVLDLYKWSGDYPGYAQIELEKLYPGTTALFFQGAGADQNPLPRHTVPLAIQYGKTLAAAVERVLSEDMKTLEPTLSTAYSEVELSLTTAPTKEQFTALAKNTKGYQQKWANRMLEKIEKKESFATSYPFPLQVWKLGNQAIMTLGGELVVDYAINLKKIFGQETFVMGYSNDVMTYIPSATILREGGYEGEAAAIVYGLPATWASDVEIQILNGLVQLAKEAGVTKPESRVIKSDKK
ncbi:neutral/alkaline non-lysosomal ceramidase N-terminal domain-containing protein [Dyadobacter sp. CY343]|uniref:neutral/alkaline non-lysosomal ceramidase N-terminal domain-containing protein n=1 Tax=Dyadobacter sp. CY343 TaxID=2907299 RepID=UPI001F453047|nr:neutral/alkaline non-lysosomal ceramidase N-terminal domain-containing protein [Dyadobacter sp. CY343]MCE7058518.1 neutral/alkaline non-lysosomal ceramidase N-terminal domain-containing protein [Dyadobacter sp. CY343]